MLQLDTRNAETLHESRVERAGQEAESRRQLRQAGILRRGRLARCSDWLFHRFGNLLVAWGERLRQHGRPQAVPLDRRAGSLQ